MTSLCSDYPYNIRAAIFVDHFIKELSDCPATDKRAVDGTLSRKDLIDLNQNLHREARL
jgi:hypothetical protein